MGILTDSDESLYGAPKRNVNPCNNINKCSFMKEYLKNSPHTEEELQVVLDYCGNPKGYESCNRNGEDKE